MTVSPSASWTCEECGEVHQGRHLEEIPTECRECGSEALEWAYNYGHPGRFA